MSVGAVDPGVVLAWGVPRMRDLPWRRERDPWRILVAEVMLQQTQIARVIPKWEAFLERFPIPADCAAAPLGDVLRLWQGLGYPRRAKYLHATAIEVVDSHDGALPDSLEALLALPGIGPYTARAVLAFAFERDVAVVDTNIGRVLARVAGERLTPSFVQRTADDLVPQGEGWAWNQVIMDLGAVICRPTPTCDECPCAPTCAWHRADHPEPDPALGSAGVSKPQARFDGSDRQRRGLVLRSLQGGSCPESDFDQRILTGLIDDGLIVRDSGDVRLP